MQTVTYQQHLFRQLSEAIRQGATAHFAARFNANIDPAYARRRAEDERIAFARVDEIKETLQALHAGTLSPLEGVA